MLFYAASMPFAGQLKLFNALKREVMKSRSEYYKKTEETLKNKKAAREKELEKIRHVVDFENNILKIEHKLEDQLVKTIEFIRQLKEDFPKATFKGGRVECGVMEGHQKSLEHILEYLKKEKIEALHILKDAESPVQVEKQDKRIKIQKKHLKKLSSELNEFVKDVKYFLKSWVKTFQITTEMRKQAREFYEQISQIYGWYAQFFKTESKK